MKTNIDKIKERCGWMPDHPDHRDKVYAMSGPVIALPAHATLAAGLPPVYNQLQTSSCTGNSSCGLFDYTYKEEHKKFMFPSRLFPYYNARVVEGSVRSDSGAMIRDVIKSFVTKGVCVETSWPFRENKVTAKPTAKCYSDALKMEAKEYQRLDNKNITMLKTSIVHGDPFVFGLSLFDNMSLIDGTNNLLSVPDKSAEFLGGHALLCYGYDDFVKAFLVRNSWGAEWGKDGNFMVSYDYMTNPELADDFWTIKKVS